MILNSMLVAIGLAMDAFAVSLGVGTMDSTRDHRSKFRLAFHFGLFQMGMTLLGWVAGNTIAPYISQVDHWLAFGLLAYVGFKMIRSGLQPDEQSYPGDPSKGGLMVMLSVATSLDALAVGLSMAMILAPVIVPSIIIGVITFDLSLFGLYFGAQLGQRFGKQMEIVGGVLLFLIGLRVLITHLLA